MIEVHRGTNSPEVICRAGISIRERNVVIAFCDPRGLPNGIPYELCVNDFRELVEAMLRSNADATIKAFAAALKDGIPPQVRNCSYIGGLIKSPETAQ
jgi:hypothetical protein